MKLIIAEKPMLARAIASAIPGPAAQHDGYMTKGDYSIVAAFGHLLTLKDPEDYQFFVQIGADQCFPLNSILKLVRIF